MCKWGIALTIHSVATGANLESQAVVYLQSYGIMLLHRNFHCKYGEIDLIAKDNDVLVFIEVRYRKNDFFGSAKESITLHKQRKIICAANFYLQTRNWAQQIACRFDVIAMTGTIDNPQIEWIKDAFNA